mmetsp:Transcript_15521/g.41729  ORF Transcript_15521/g.41729 Transcript_15521/m.41729 type:complete len:419 (+) Transcript_15521:421-1677(+)
MSSMGGASTPKRRGSVKSRLDQIFGRRLTLADDQVKGGNTNHLDDDADGEHVLSARSGAGRPPVSARKVKSSESVFGVMGPSKPEYTNTSLSSSASVTAGAQNVSPGGRQAGDAPLSPARRASSAKSGKMFSPRSADSSRDEAKDSSDKIAAKSNGVGDFAVTDEPSTLASVATPKRSRGAVVRTKTGEANKTYWKLHSDELEDSTSNALASFASNRNNSARRDKEGSGRLTGRRFNSFQMVTERIAMFGASHDSRLVSEQLFADVLAELPSRVRASECTLIYSLNSDKRSLKAFYRRVAKRRFLLFFVRDNYGSVFGAFSSSVWKTAQVGYYGADDCLLFRVEPTFEVFRSTGQNQLFQLSTSQYIAMGGQPDFGLFLDADFQQGRTCACDTFGNRILSKYKDFDIVDMEVWGFKVD